MAMDGASGRGGESANPPGKPVRNMDDIARLFMAGARDVAGNPPPAEQNPAPVMETPTPMPVAPVLAPQPAPRHPPKGPPAALVALSPATADAGWSAILAAAGHLAGEWDAGVAVIGMHGGKLKLMRAGAPRFGMVAVAQKSGADFDIQLARTLFGMRENVAHWIVALPMGRSMDHVLAAVRDWLLICGTENESIVSGYRILKNVVAADPLDEPRTLRLFLSCQDYAQAAVVHARLRRAAREFLQQDLPLAGVSANVPAEVQTIAEFDVGPDDSAAWSSVAEFLHDLLGNAPVEEESADAQAIPELAPALATSEPEPESPVAVLWPAARPAEAPPAADLQHESAANLPPLSSPEQRWDDLWHIPSETPALDLAADLSTFDATSQAFQDLADVPQCDQPANTETAVAVPVAEAPKAQPATAPAPQAAPAGIPAPVPMLRAVELASLSDDARWNAVLASASELCHGEQIEACPPSAPRAGLWLDRDGKLHLWVLSDAGSSWILLWQWAREHRQILALTRKDRWVDTAADVRIHVVVPSELSCKPIELPGVSWYRLTLVRWSDRTAAVVVPA